MRLVVRFIGLVSTLILVRLLDPGDFGIIAMAMTIVAAIELLTAFGFDITLIQDQNAGSDEYNTAWTLNAALGGASAILLIALAYPAASFYEEPRLVHIFQCIALASIFQGLQNVGLVDFRKHLQFQKEFLFQLIIKLFSFCVTVGLAFALRSYWALVIGTVSSRLMGLLLSYRMHPYRPTLSLAAIEKVFGFSKWLLVNNVLNFIRFRGPEFIIGKMLGISNLGIFVVSYEISNLPTTELVAPINRALLPGFSKISDDMERSRDAFVQAASVLALLTLPIGFGIAATADLFTPIFLGQKWVDAIPIIRILALFGAGVAIQSPIGAVLLALGKPKLLGILSAWHAMLLIPIIIIWSKSGGLEGTALALLVTYVGFLPVYYGVAARSLGMSFSNILTVFLRPVVAALLMYFFVSYAFDGKAATLLNLSLAVSSGVVVFTLAVFVMWFLSRRVATSAESYLMNMVLAYAEKARKKAG